MAEFYKIAEHTLTNIADAMRMWTQKTDKVTPDEMPQEVDAVFNAGADIGYTTGHNHGKAEGIEEGKQLAHKEEWDERQRGGARTSYTYGFAGETWTDQTFDPLYDMYVSDALGMFTQSGIVDIPGCVARSGIVLDFSNSSRFTNMFGYSSTKYAGYIDARKPSSLQQMFDYAASLISVSLRLRDDGSQSFTNNFRGCTALEDLEITGVIGKDGFNLSACTKLKKASIESVVNAASTTASITIPLSSVAVKREFETSAGANDGNASQAWKDLIATRPTVTFALS